jgi:hypothetical protein
MTDLSPSDAPWRPSMTNQHPITPPPELVKQWEEQFLERPTINGCFIQSYIATQAARWGADQELEACVKWVSEYCPYFGDYPLPEDKLRADRRPEPPSLKEQALNDLDDIPTHDDEGRQVVDLSNIRRALEALPE